MKNLLLTLVILLFVSLFGVGCEKNDNSESLNMTSYDVEINYSLTLGEAVSSGGYDYVHQLISETNFPKTKEGKVRTEILLIESDSIISSEEAINEMEINNLRPAELREVLALGAKYPELQREFGIIAFGSKIKILDGHGIIHDIIPELWEGGSKRRLDLALFDNYRGLRYYRFAAVRK